MPSNVYAIADDEEALLRDELLEAFGEARDDIDMDELLTALENSDQYAIEQASGYDHGTNEILYALLAYSLLRAFSRAGREAASLIDGFEFNALDGHYRGWLEDHVNETIGAMRASAQAVLAGILLRGISEGLPPAILAERIRNGLYLLDRNERALEAMRARMIEAGMTEAQVSARLAQLYGQADSFRARMLARTEISAVVTMAQLLVWRQAQRQGLIPWDAKKRWITVPDEKRCPVCKGLHGVTVALAAQFPGGFDGPGAHPLCRCRLVLVIGGQVLGA